MFKKLPVALATLAITIFAGLLTPALAGSNAGPSAQFQRIIADQISAFRNDDAERAYSFASPSIKRLFPSSRRFIEMVASTYKPVYRPRHYRFGVTSRKLGRPTQHVVITGPTGRLWLALYAFERQPDGSWKIAAVVLQQSEGADA